MKTKKEFSTAQTETQEGYEAPVVTVVNVDVETGFALSPTPPGPPSYNLPSFDF